MLPIAAENFPTTPDELAAAVVDGFAASGVLVQNVRAEGADLAELKALRIDLTGACFTRGFRLFTAAAETTARVVAERCEVTGAPVEFEGTPLEVRLVAEHAEFHFAGQPVAGALVLAGAANGSVALGVKQAALEEALNRLAKGAAEKQGVTVKSTKLELTARSPRSVGFQCAVTAKVFVMTAEVSLSGELAVDEQLNARLSRLTLGGEAMITKLASGFVRPHLDKLEGRTFPLLALVPAGMKLRDVEIVTTDGLEVRAKFGRD